LRALADHSRGLPFSSSDFFSVEVFFCTFSSVRPDAFVLVWSRFVWFWSRFERRVGAGADFVGIA
jgi:hypothetical protein